MSGKIWQLLANMLCFHRRAGSGETNKSAFNTPSEPQGEGKGEGPSFFFLRMKSLIYIILAKAQAQVQDFWQKSGEHVLFS